MLQIIKKKKSSLITAHIAKLQSSQLSLEAESHKRHKWDIKSGSSQDAEDGRKEEEMLHRRKLTEIFQHLDQNKCSEYTLSNLQGYNKVTY